MVNTPTPMTPNSNGDLQSAEKLKQSAGYIGGVIVLALAGYFGWTYYQGSSAHVDTVAADKYVAAEQKFEALNSDEAAENKSELLATVDKDVDAIVTEHGSTIYAWQALMMKARIATDANDFETAKQALRKALDIPLNDAGLHAIAQLRYATALLANGDTEEAITQASMDMPKTFEGSQQELLGDIYSAKNDKENAIRSYQNAWDLLSSRSEERGILRLKLEGLGIMPTPIEAEPPVVNQQATPNVMANIDGANTVATDENAIEGENGIEDSSNESDVATEAVSAETVTIEDAAADTEINADDTSDNGADGSVDANTEQDIAKDAEDADTNTE